MKKLLLVATLVALVMGTSIDASAKVKKSKRKVAQTTKQTTQTTPKQMKSNNNTMVVDQGMWTDERAKRLDNGDVANLEQAFVIGFYENYVYNGEIYNDNQMPYLKLKFTKDGLESLKKDDGTYNWDLITGNGMINSSNFSIKEVAPKKFLIEGDGHHCYITVMGEEPSYRISKVESELK